MARSPHARRTKLVLVAVGLALFAALCGRFPLFHVVSLKQSQQQQPAAISTEEFVREFWEVKLIPATERAADVKELLAALKNDPAAARKQFGRSLGMSSTMAMFVQGSGQVTAIEEDAVRVTLEGAPEGTQVSLVTGLLFGNAVRDATGLLDVSAYPDSQAFNDLSTELNRVVETKVSPGLREQAAVGKPIRFAGCIELEEEVTPEMLQIVPVKVEWP